VEQLHDFRRGEEFAEEVLCEHPFGVYFFVEIFLFSQCAPRLRLNKFAESSPSREMPFFLEKCREGNSMRLPGAIVDASMKIDRALEPGLLESVYEPVLARVFANRGLTVERQKVIRFEYDGKIFDEGLRVDLLVEHDRYRQTAVLRLTGSSSP
jgi:hypothetical protein